MHAENGSLKTLVTSAQKRPFYELSPDTVWDVVFYVLSLGPHFCYPIPSSDNSTGDGSGQEVPHLNWPN